MIWYQSQGRVYSKGSTQGSQEKFGDEIRQLKQHVQLVLEQRQAFVMHAMKNMMG